MPARNIGTIRCLRCTYLHDIKEGINTFTKKELDAYEKVETHKFFKLRSNSNGEIVYGSFCKQCNNITSVKKVNKFFSTKFFTIDVIDTEEWSLSEWKKLDKDIYDYVKENLEITS